MRTHKSSASRTPTTAAAPSERRSRARLRELCDEVIASFRAASSKEVITEAERSESRAILSKIVPLAGR
jgi:hypothetical protein